MIPQVFVHLILSNIVGTTVLTSTTTSGTAVTGATGTSVTSQTGLSSASVVSTSLTGSASSTSPSSASVSSTAFTTGTTTKRCEEMQAVDEQTSKQITVTPTDLPQNQKPQFQPTSNQGVSFPDNEKTPTIIVHFGKPTEVQSVTIPRDKTPGANVEQFEVTFYSPNGKKINDKPIQSTSSPTYNTKKPAHLDSTQIPSNQPVSQVEITILSSTNGESPKGVILDIKACTEITTGECFLSLKRDFASHLTKCCRHNRCDINNNYCSRFNRKHFNIRFKSNWIIKYFYHYGKRAFHSLDPFNGFVSFNKSNHRNRVDHWYHHQKM